MERGTVSGRVALLLRSAEVKPLFDRFVRPFPVGLSLSFLFLPASDFRAGPVGLVLLGMHVRRAQREVSNRL